MNKKEFKTFDVDKHRPQVLLIGNGVVYNENNTWSRFIEKLSDRNVVLPEDVPYSIQATIKVPNSDKERRDRYFNELSKIEYSNNDIIDQLLKVHFDAILTTNYTYEIENYLYDGYCKLSNATKTKKSWCTDSCPESKYLLKTYNRFSKNELLHDIWHIHGETRRKSSIILTIDEYARLTNEIIEYLKIVKNSYENYYENLIFKSWIDYFIMGDVYILGLGFDFTEFDLWWLVNRKQRENADAGRLIYYSPKNKNNNVVETLREINVECRNLDFEISTNNTYNDFYHKAILDIKREVEKS